MLPQKPIDSLVDNMIDSYGVDQTKRIFAKKAGWIDVPPTIDEFMSDSNFMGDVESVFPAWRKALRDIYPNEFFSPYLEIALTGAIGLGKTTISVVGTMYDMLRLQYLEDPHSYFSIGRNSKIAFALINANLALAKSVVYDKLDTFVQQSPYFSDLHKKAQMAKRNKSYLPKRVHVVQGSRFTHVLGMDMIGAILSELNFQEAVKDQAYDNYTNGIIRLKSRFRACRSRTGYYPARIWLDSSKNDANSFVEKHLEENADNPELIIFDYPYWEVHWQRIGYSGKMFKVFIGNQHRDPFIVEHVSQTANLDEALILDVPIEHQSEFKANLPRSLRDIAGRGTWSTSKLMSSVERLKSAMMVQNPVQVKEIELDFWRKDEALIQYIDFTKLELDSRPRFIHIDLGIKKDRTGIACTRLDGYRTFQRLNPATGQVEPERMPYFHTEWVMAIKAPPGQEVSISKIETFVTHLAANNVNIAKVSTDGYQSTNLRQNLTYKGFSCELLSVDRTKEPYEFLRDVILEGRWSGVYHDILFQELKDLQDTGKKYDHSFEGSKDLADAVCGATYSAFMNLAKSAAVNSMEEYMKAFREISSGSVYDQINMFAR